MEREPNSISEPLIIEVSKPEERSGIENIPEIKEIIEIIRDKGSEHPDAIHRITKLMNQRREIADKILDPKRRALAQIDFDRIMSVLHLSAGYSDAALQDLEDARLLAGQEGMDDLAEEIGLDIDKLPPPLE